MPHPVHDIAHGTAPQLPCSVIPVSFLLLPLSLQGGRLGHHPCFELLLINSRPEFEFILVGGLPDPCHISFWEQLRQTRHA